VFDLKCMANAVATVLLLAGLAGPAAKAGPLTFTPNGDSNAGNLKCEVAVKSLGGLALKNGSASITGRVINIKAGSAFFDTPRTVLVGSVLRSEANLTSDPPNVTGLALFLMGDWQDQIDDGSSKDTIFCKEGHLEGRILGIENDSLSANVNGIPQHIPLTSVLYIRSPRVFVFKIALKSRQPMQKDTVIVADSLDSSFRPTAPARTLSGSVIPASDRKDDGMGGLTGGATGARTPAAMPGLGAENLMQGAGGLPLNSFNRPGTAVPNQQDNSFDSGEEANKFSTIHTKWGDQKLTLPPGLLD
jgi:hypothetical protein